MSKVANIEVGQEAINSAVTWALTHNLAMYDGTTAFHTAFSISPSFITQKCFLSLTSMVSALGKLIHLVSEDSSFLVQAITPLIEGDAFFETLLKMHNEINSYPEQARRLPLLIMRSDFMNDSNLGAQLVECNSIAAGMGPFGQLTHELHRFMQIQWPDFFNSYICDNEVSAYGELVENHAIERLATGIAIAAKKIKKEFNESSPPTFLMVIQNDEDNIYDQGLLEQELQGRGIITLRKTFRELHDCLYSGDNYRLLLKGYGAIDAVYLRAGYQFKDYQAHDLDTYACCEALTATRILIEKHRVAVNATVSQQLASSKRVQMLLTNMDVQEITEFGLSTEEATSVKTLLTDMQPINANSLALVQQQPLDAWVLKNQGEGGGHCIFSNDILDKLADLKESEYAAWSLMRRLHPLPCNKPALLVRKGMASLVHDLISEIGLFTVHVDGAPAFIDTAYAGYLIRSKSASTTEGGVHSGQGVLNSLVFSN